MNRLFRDRVDAGQLLAARLTRYANREDVLVLGLPRGGVPVAFEVATKLNAPLDVFVVRKLGVPGYEELAMGAIAGGGVRVFNTDVVRIYRIPGSVIDQVAAVQQRELERREQTYRGHSKPPEIRGKIVILVDDGIATGSTMRAAIHAVRSQSPARLIVAVPVAPASQTCLADDVDEWVILMTPENFHAVGQWYTEFDQTSDEEVTQLLAKATAQFRSGKSAEYS